VLSHRDAILNGTASPRGGNSRYTPSRLEIRASAGPGWVPKLWAGFT
jgi:hypothetical protein